MKWIRMYENVIFEINCLLHGVDLLKNTWECFSQTGKKDTTNSFVVPLNVWRMFCPLPPLRIAYLSQIGSTRAGANDVFSSSPFPQRFARCSDAPTQNQHLRIVLHRSLHLPITSLIDSYERPKQTSEEPMISSRNDVCANLAHRNGAVLVHFLLDQYIGDFDLHVVELRMM